MSSETTISPIGSPPPRRSFQVITRVDKDTLKIIERKRGPVPRKRSKSEAAYLLLLAGIEAERAASEVQVPPEEGRRTGEDRRASA